MLKYCLLLNAATTTLLFSLASFFTTVEHNVLQAQQTDIDQTFEEVATEENNMEEESQNDYALNLKGKQFISSEDVLVINLTGQPIPTQNQQLIVTGIVRPFVKEEFEQDYNLTWDLEIQQKLETEYSQKPVLVVNSIYPSNQP